MVTLAHGMPRESRNLPSANKNPETIQTNLAKEIKLGRTVVHFNEPFSKFQVSPIGLVPKKQSGQFVLYSTSPTLNKVTQSFPSFSKMIIHYSIQHLLRNQCYSWLRLTFFQPLGYFLYILRTGNTYEMGRQILFS